MTQEVRLAGNTYRIGERPLSAMEQFHVTRRLGPALVVAGVTFKMILEGKNISMDDLVNVAGPVMQVVSHMSDEDVEYVIMKCLRTVDRQSGGAWAPITTPDGKQFMFADMDQAVMVRLTIEVLQANLANFAKGMNDDGNSPSV
jgi:hypothetical protein